MKSFINLTDKCRQAHVIKACDCDRKLAGEGTLISSSAQVARQVIIIHNRCEKFENATEPGSHDQSMLCDTGRSVEQA